jgi:hypothetical protein
MQLAPHWQVNPQGQFLLTHLVESSLVVVAGKALRHTARVAVTPEATLGCSLLRLEQQVAPATRTFVAVTAGTALLVATVLFIFFV